MAKPDIDAPHDRQSPGDTGLTEPPRVRWRLRCFGLRHDYSVTFAG
jgi:hypothetical protein